MSLFSQPVVAARGVFRALLALALALALLVGPPVVLLRFVGNPLPTVIPSWEDVTYAITNGQIDSWTWIKALAVIGWVAWANLAVSFMVEIAAAIRGAKARVVRGLGLGQWFASRVVAQCSLAASVLFQSTVGVAAVGGLPPLPVIAAPFLTHSVPGIELGPSGQETSAPARSVEVGRRDTLWGLAEAHLGDGERWLAIRDANVGRTMDDGTVLRPGFTSVSKGWSLIIPDRSTAEQVVPSGYLTAGSVEVEVGDNLWRLSRHRLETVGSSVDDAEVLHYLNEVVLVNDGAIDDPDLIYPGQVFTFPELGDAPEAPGRPQAAGVATRSSGRGGSEPGVSGQRHRRAEHGSLARAAEFGEGAPSPSATAQGGNSSAGEVEADSSPGGDGLLERAAFVGLGAAAALLAAGVRRAVRRRRRYALAHRTPGAVPRPPNPDLEQIERALQRHADDKAVRWLDAAIGSLATRPIWAGEHVAQPVGVTWRADHLDVEFSAADPMAAPLPWTTHDGGRHWLLSRSTAIKDLPTAGPDDPVPALVTVGRGRQVNLEGVGLLAVSGDGDGPSSVARSIVHELATSTSAGTIDIRTTMPIDGVGGYDLVQTQSPAVLTDELVPWLEGLAPRLEESLSTNAFAYRIVSEDEPMCPVIVITDERAAAAMPALVARAEQRSLPIALVVIGRTESEFCLSLSEGGATLQPWGETIEPQLLSAEAARQLGELLLAAASSQEDPLVAGLELSAPASADRPGIRLAPVEQRPSEDSSAPAEGEESSPAGVARAAESEPGSLAEPSEGGLDDEPIAEPTVLVKVLGDVEVVGIDSDLTSQQLSLLTYLACHGSSSRDAVIDALWDGQVISQSRFPNLLAELRSRLGRHHLPESRDSRYRLQGVTTDLTDFERQVGVANRQAPQAAAVTLRAAMELVRGIPLTPPGRRFWSWVGDETYLAARVEALVADTAARLARLEQDLGNLEGAQRACEQGLKASPTDETLVVVLTEVYLEQGKPGLARRLVDRWEDKISRLECGEPSDKPRKRLAG